MIDASDMRLKRGHIKEQSGVNELKIKFNYNRQRKVQKVLSSPKDRNRTMYKRSYKLAYVKNRGSNVVLLKETASCSKSYPLPSFTLTTQKKERERKKS